MIEGLERLPVDVLNLTPDDLFLWEELRRRELPTRIISTNLAEASADGLPARYAVVERGAGPSKIRIGFVGLSNPRRVKPRSGFEAIPPEQAVAQTLPELASRADLIVVLADLPEEEAVRLAEAHEEIDVVLRGEGRFRLGRPRIVNKAVLLNSVERGRYLGQLTVKLSSAGDVDSVQPEFINLDGKVAEDPYFASRQTELARLKPRP